MQVFKKLLRNRTIVVLVSIVVLLGLVGGVQLALRGAGAAGAKPNKPGNACHGHQACVFDAVLGFTSTQGLNGWEYSYSTDQEATLPQMSWDSVDSRWFGSDANCRIGANYQQPDATCDAVRTWVAPNAGTATLSSNGAIGVDNSCGAASTTDGVQIRVLQNGAQIWPASGWQVIPNGTSFSFPVQTVSVASGDSIQFVATPLGTTNTCFQTNWDQDISFTR
jgi:hypothetical protein